VGRYEVVNGVFEYDDRQIPLNLRARIWLVRMRLEPGGRYRGELESNRVRVVPDGAGRSKSAPRPRSRLDKSTIDVSRLRIATKESRADLVGSLTNLRWPRGPSL